MTSPTKPTDIPSDSVRQPGESEPWLRCPSTHCERRGECTSPSDCIVKDRPHQSSAGESELRDAERVPSAEAMEAAAPMVNAITLKFRISGAKIVEWQKRFAHDLDVFASQVVAAQIQEPVDLWMKDPSTGKLEQISDGNHGPALRKAFLENYLKSGWTDPEFHPRAQGINSNPLTVGEAGAQARPWPQWIHPSRWRHRKRGSSCDVLTATAEAQCATGPINEGDHVTIYQHDNGDWYVRKTDEFQDGRFERIDLIEDWPAERAKPAASDLERAGKLMSECPRVHVDA